MISNLPKKCNAALSWKVKGYTFHTDDVPFDALTNETSEARFNHRFNISLDLSYDSRVTIFELRANKNKGILATFVFDIREFRNKLQIAES